MVYLTTRVGAAMAVAIRCQHGAFFSRALELLAHKKVESVKSVGSSDFLLGALPTEPVLNAQLASLVGEGAGKRGEIAGDLEKFSVPFRRQGQD